MNRAEPRLILLWLVLMVITVCSWSSAWDFGWGGRWQAAIVIALAFIKARIVFLDFMEVRDAPMLLRLILEAWAASVGVTLIVLATAG